MAIKIDGTTVINNSREMKSIVDTANLVKYENVGANLTSTSSNINFTTPLMSCTLSADTTFTASGVAEGKSAQILLDLTSSAHTPTWPSSVNWANGSEPTWSGYQYWHIIFTCASASEIRATAFGYVAQGGGTPSSWPAGTVYAQQGGTNTTGYADHHESGNLGITGEVSGTSRCRVNFYQRSGGGCEMYFVPTGTGGDTPYYKNTVNATVNVTSGSSTKIWEEGTVTPDSVRLVTYTQYGTLASDTGYVAPTGVGTGTTNSITASTTVYQQGSSSSSNSGTMECWVRKSGYVDTKVATWKFNCAVYVTGTGCFTADTELYTWDSENETVYKQVMADAYNDWRTNYANKKPKYVLGQNNETKEILAFGKLLLNETIYGINGSTPIVSGGHPFLTSDGWKCMDLAKGNTDYPDLELTQLAVGDTLKKYNADTNSYYDEEVTDITGTELEIDAYVLDVSGDDTYIVNGHIVHNK